MPYKENKDLPSKVRKNLPMGAQSIYRKVYNAAHKDYKDPKKRSGSLEEVAAKVAWHAVKSKYKKSRKGNWVRK
tara:strand:- start:446 stop:667 length:222 start_codon:yes stop_codon:yes gene_type:complete